MPARQSVFYKFDPLSEKGESPLDRDLLPLIALRFETRDAGAGWQAAMLGDPLPLQSQTLGSWVFRLDEQH